jgi:hypothetical protein
MPVRQSVYDKEPVFICSGSRLDLCNITLRFKGALTRTMYNDLKQQAIANRDAEALRLGETIDV